MSMWASDTNKPNDGNYNNNELKEGTNFNLLRAIVEVEQVDSHLGQLVQPYSRLSHPFYPFRFRQSGARQVGTKRAV